MPMTLDRRHRTVAALGVAQTLAWASSYYLPALLANAMARELGVSAAIIFAAFSAALLASAAVGPYAGRCIDRWGGRPVLMLSNGVFALGLLALSQAQGLWSLFGAWLMLGLAMGGGLYEAAFATLVRLYGREARNAITGITLIAGFASTVGWPLTGWLEAHWGWRTACMAWAGLHLLVALPLNFSVPRAQGLVAAVPESASSDTHAVEPETPAQAPAWRSVLILSWVFAVTWFISTAMAAHLPRLLLAGGASLAAAVAAGALIGPAQVAARLATLLHPVAAALLALQGAPLATAFALLHGAGNGILTIAKGTLPLILFGPQGYGQRQGWLMVPARLAQALAPWLFGLCLDRWGAQALWLSSGLGLLAFAALLALPKPLPDRA